ncbi:DUF2259 domain-containing protein [Treponema endosymbiont of Eucomonympha sp.]|uniref:DUF2259 domain-containing protein n=1 Tax=Treponema endosymbiont of Eucomonympha sp. TaxID=1580831 RepID=UPI0007857E38|nr:DUF2259 domain-containing protein [Treponema endosymbiont of Eucomonympha sp.]
MKNRIAGLGCALLFATGAALSAGDAARFVDMGFSPDGKTYLFAQHGETGKTLQGYAEIYVVDVARNDFVPGGVFRINPSAATRHRSGEDVFAQLQTVNAAFLNRQRCIPVPLAQVLYTRAPAPGVVGNDLIFRDFENLTGVDSLRYRVRLAPLYEGTGEKARSSFYIVAETQDKDGTPITRSAVGNPHIKRAGVNAYSIERIFADKSGKSLVFLIAKTVVDGTGVSVRYMVETAQIP